VACFSRETLTQARQPSATAPRAKTKKASGGAHDDTPSGGDWRTFKISARSSGESLSTIASDKPEALASDSESASFSDAKARTANTASARTRDLMVTTSTNALPDRLPAS